MTDTDKDRQPDRESERAAMLEEALRRPGIREVMEVYQDWEQADRGLDAYRAATKEPMIITTTDHANIRTPGA